MTTQTALEDRLKACPKCHTTLGKFNDDRNRFLKAIDYLDRAGSED